MARLRQPDRPETPGEVPEHLRVCYVEDWAEPDDAPACRNAAPHDEQECRTMGWALVAWQRWKAARREWADTHGVDLVDVPGMAGCAPRWRQSQRVVGGRASDG